MAFTPYMGMPQVSRNTPVKKPKPKAVIKPIVAASPPAAPAPVDYAKQFYPYNDYYAGLLTKLASMRDLALGNLSTDLTNRTQNVNSLVNASRDPLNQNYSRATQEAAAVNDAVSNRLNAQGGTAVGDLRSQLANLNQDPTAATQNLSNYYSGSSGANYAMDSGDVQRLIGRRAEENTLLDKTPGLMAGQMQTDYANNQGGIIKNYLDQAFNVAGQGADAEAQYQKDKFSFIQDQKQNALAATKAEETVYWDNYWKKQDLNFRKWQTQIASGDRKAANATRKEIENQRVQSAQDIANIRAGATQAAAETRAGATVTAANIRAKTAAETAAAAKATAKSKAGSNINKQRAYKAALDAVVNPKTGVLANGINPAGFNSDWTITRIINGVLKSYGISPQSPQGKSVVSAVHAQAAGHVFHPGAITTWNKAHPEALVDPKGRYTYDPNWVKKAAAAAKKKKAKPKKK